MVELAGGTAVEELQLRGYLKVVEYRSCPVIMEVTDTGVQNMHGARARAQEALERRGSVKQRDLRYCLNPPVGQSMNSTNRQAYHVPSCFYFD